MSSTFVFGVMAFSNWIVESIVCPYFDKRDRARVDPVSSKDGRITEGREGNGARQH